MKNLSKISESSTVSQSISCQEMLEDIKNLITWSLAENIDKKAIAAKYGINSRKTAEIEKGILLKAQEDRAKRTKFDETDIELFKRLTNCPELYNKIESFFMAEPEDFINYLKDYYEDKVKAEKLEQYVKWKPSDFKYMRIPYGKQYTIKFYQFILRYLSEHGSATADARDAREKSIELVLSKLNEQLKDFKEDLLNRAEQQALDFYDTILEKLNNWKKEAEKWENKMHKYESEWKAERKSGWYWNSEGYKNLEHNQKVWYAKYANGKYIKEHFSKSEYGTYCREQAEREYEMKKHTMAEKIVDRNFDYANIQFTNVKKDPKWIEMLITDGIKKVYARSIIAAEFSEKVTVHFRFILTDRK